MMMKFCMVLCIFTFLLQSYCFRLPVRVLGYSKRQAKGSISALKAVSTIHERSKECLDLTSLIKILQSHTVTQLGHDQVKTSYFGDALSVIHAYEKVNQLNKRVTDILPMTSTVDLMPLIAVIESHSRVLEEKDMVGFALEFEHIMKLHSFMEENAKTFSLFSHEIQALRLPTEVINTFNNSFNEKFKLNSNKYPALQKISHSMKLVEKQIAEIMQRLIKSSGMKDRLADNGQVQVDGRSCLMIKQSMKNGVGIVHGISNTGQTVYIEPYAIVEPTNMLKEKRLEYELEEHKILNMMCLCIRSYSQQITQSVQAFATMDIYRAKALIGERMNGIIPEVQTEGYIHCINAKHPLLLLRSKLKQRASVESSLSLPIDPVSTESSIVGNTFTLHENTSTLIISGPNAGGKTIVMKTCGLLAWMVKYAIPLPVKFGSRMDYFDEILADIGDSQSVTSDISTFSGHLQSCQEILSIVREDVRDDMIPLHPKEQQPPAQQPHSTKDTHLHKHNLVLLDELGTGTDPIQGAVLAQAILEAFIAIPNTRIITTTHYARIKELAFQDTRFRIAAMEFINNQPTYRLKHDFVGESYALELADRMHFPGSILSRAHDLLDEESKRTLLLQTRLQQQIEESFHTQKQLEEETARQVHLTKMMNATKQALEVEIEQIQHGYIQSYLQEFKKKEDMLTQLIEQLKHQLRSNREQQQEMKKKDDTSTAMSALLFDGQRVNITSQQDIIQLTTLLQHERTSMEQQWLTEEVLSQLDVIQLPEGEYVNIGDELMILDPTHAQYGQCGIVSKVDRGRTRITLRISTVSDTAAYIPMKNAHRAAAATEDEEEVKIERHLVGKRKPKSTSSSSIPSIFQEMEKMSRNIQKFQAQQKQQQQQHQSTGSEDRTTLDETMATKKKKVLIELTREEAKLLKMAQEELVGHYDEQSTTSATSKSAKSSALPTRTAENTVSLSTLSTVAEAQTMIQERLKNLPKSSKKVLYLHHGNIVSWKQKLRNWLSRHPLITSWATPALKDGGDAYTIIRL